MSDRPDATEVTDRQNGGDRSRCATCNHEQVAEIDMALRGRQQSGESLAKIANRFGLTESSVKRHARNHLTDPTSESERNIAKRATDPESIDTLPPPTEPSAAPAQPQPPPDPPPAEAKVVAAGTPATTDPPPTATNPPSSRKPEKCGRPCVTCTHEKADEINEALCQGMPLARLERMYGMSDTSLMRHRDNCMSDAARHQRLAALDEMKIATREGMRERLEEMIDRLNSLMKKAENDLGDDDAKAGYRDVTAIHREMRGYLELLAKLLGHLGADIAIQITGHPTVVAMMQTVNAIVIPCERCGPMLKDEMKTRQIAA